MSDRIRVLVVDDHAIFRRGVIDTLASANDIVVEAECETAADALALARELLPDVVLLDLGLPGGSGLDVVAPLHRDCPVSRIVVLTASEDERAIARALREGASAYLLKGIGGDELVRAVRAAAAGEGYVSPSLAARLLRDLTRDGASALATLSERERSVFDGLARGRTNREIALDLGLAEKTVKFYVTNVLAKLHVRNRVEAAILAKGAARD